MLRFDACTCRRTTMTTRKLWALPFALVGGMAVGAALALRRRHERRHAEKHQARYDLQAWEGEGGSLAPPATTQRRS
jgi:hypothetical protein